MAGVVTGAARRTKRPSTIPCVWVTGASRRTKRPSTIPCVWPAGLKSGARPAKAPSAAARRRAASAACSRSYCSDRADAVFAAASHKSWESPSTSAGGAGGGGGGAIAKGQNARGSRRRAGAGAGRGGKGAVARGSIVRGSRRRGGGRGRAGVACATSAFSAPALGGSRCGPSSPPSSSSSSNAPGSRGADGGVVRTAPARRRRDVAPSARNDGPAAAATRTDA